MSISDNIKKKLRDYYKDNGIVPGKGFNCKNLKYCDDPKGFDLARGMQCHIGPKYGEDRKLKILVASLDCGNGGASEINDRTNNIITDAQKATHNPHMTGTYQALAYFLEDDPAKWRHPETSKLVQYMIMINTCKCCKIGSTNQMKSKYFKKCGEYTVGEILRIEPDVILFQGKNSYLGCQNLLSNIEEIENDKIKKLVRVFNHPKLKCYAVLCIHPSARFKFTKSRVDFYKNTLPEIAKYIKANPLQKVHKSPPEVVPPCFQGGSRNL